MVLTLRSSFEYTIDSDACDYFYVVLFGTGYLNYQITYSNVSLSEPFIVTPPETPYEVQMLII